MLHVITPKVYHNYEAVISRFQKDLKTEVPFSEKSHEDPIYLVYIDDQYGQVGGAELYPTTVQSRAASYARRIPGLRTGSMYDICNIFFKLPAHADLNLLQSQSLKGRFYQALYEALTNFCLIKKIDAVLSVVPLQTHLELQRFGCWPFSYQGKLPTLPERLVDNPDTYVFGALDMDYSAYPQFQEKRESFESDMATAAAQHIQRLKESRKSGEDLKK